MELIQYDSVAGSGKTRALLDALELELAAGVPKDRIAFVSFTQEGSYVGRDRAIQRFGGLRADYPYFRTLHSIAYKELNLTRSCVMSPLKYKYLGDALGMKFWGHISADMAQTSDDRYLFFDQLYRNNPRAGARVYEEIGDKDKIQFVRRQYRRFRELNGLYDFTDFLEKVVEMRVTLDIDVAFVDEAQDLTPLQWKAVWMLFKNCKRVYVAGDSDQAIFGWSGADVDYFMGLKPTRPAIILSHTHRCPARVTRYANKVLDLIHHKVPKVITSREEPGRVEVINKLDDLNIDSVGSWLFLSRNNCFLDEIEEFLKRRKQVYVRDGKSSIRASDIKLIEQYESARKGLVEVTEGSELQAMIRQGASLDSPWFDALQLDPDVVDYYRDLYETKRTKEDASRIRLSTIHGVKGAEADNVVLVQDVTARSFKGFDEDHDSEMRILYVAVTRSKRNLFLLAPQSNKHFPVLY